MHSFHRYLAFAASLVALTLPSYAQDQATEVVAGTAVVERVAPAPPPQPLNQQLQGQRSGSGRAWWSTVAERGWLGVRMSTKEEAKRVYDSGEWPEVWVKVPNLRWIAEEWDGEGTLVLEVFPETPAEKFGILPGDVITSFNGIRTSNPGILAFVVQRVIIGRDANLEVSRDGDTRIVLVEIGMHPEDARRLAAEKEAARKAEAAPEK